MDKKLLMNRYNELHGILLNQKKGLIDQLNNLAFQLDKQHIHDRAARERSRLELFKKELGPSLDLEEFKYISSVLYPSDKKHKPRSTLATM